MSRKNRSVFLSLLLIFCLLLSSCATYVGDLLDQLGNGAFSAATADPDAPVNGPITAAQTDADGSEIGQTGDGADASKAPAFITLDSIPAFTDRAYVAVNGNVPFFTAAERSDAVSSYETYSPLDRLGRCGAATASIGTDLMPTTAREKISMVQPTGWKNKTYPGLISGEYLYNRCHLIGFQLTAEDANARNLITGTRYLNVTGMLPFENMVADYIKETGNHVLYRVTPVFSGDELVARGVLMEAWSVEDDGDGILFCVYCYNVQPGIEIDYATGDSRVAEETSAGSSGEAGTSLTVVNWNSPVRRNATASLTVRGTPDTLYSIRVYYSSGASSAAGLEDKTSDAQGEVSWSWKIGNNTKPGEYRVVVSGSDESLTVYLVIEE